MARRQRLQAAGLFRHVMARGNGRMPIYLDDLDYGQFVNLLRGTVERFEIECWNYCLMPNHYHATLRPTQPNLSEAIRNLNGNYAQWWNKRHNRVGHVFQGRFKDQIVQREGYLLTLCRYVALNPVRAGLAARPEEWQWSSYAATVGLEPTPAFLAAPSVVRQLGEGALDRMQARFAEYVMAATDRDSMEDRIRSSEAILGDTSFKAMLRAPVRGDTTTGDETTSADTGSSTNRL